MKRNSADFLNMRIRLGKRIQELRNEKGLTQEELAATSGLDRVSIGYIEQGKRAPRLSTLLVVSKSLKVKLADIFRDI